MRFVRYIFFILILMGSTSIGFLLSKCCSDRLKELKSLANMINIFQNKIKFTHKPLAEIFKEVALIRKDTHFSEIFIKTSQKLKNKSAQLAWNEAISEGEFFLNLKNEDLNLIRTFGNMLGKTDVEGQISEINQFAILLNGQIEKAKEEEGKNSKMYKSLGTIVGLGIVILLF